MDHPAVRALALDYAEAMTSAEVVNNVRMMTVRTRFIDEAVQRSVAGGATQLLILGAGFDSHAYRFREELAPVRVFEVDRPPMQAHKRRRVHEVLGGPPPNLTYVPIDFQQEELADVLTRHGYDPARQTFVVWEGVTMYLPEAAVRDTLRFVGAHPPGSGLVFDFVYRAMIDMLARIDVTTLPEAAKPFVQRFLDLIKDEPWLFGMPVGGERELLGEYGLELRELLTIGGPESLDRYLTRADGTPVGAEAMAAAAARLAAAGPPAGTPRMSPEQMREQQRLMAYQLAEAVVARP